MNKLLLYASLLKDVKLAKTYEIRSKLIEIGYEVSIMVNEEVYSDQEIDFRENVNYCKNRDDIAKSGIELVIVVGGDGSLIGYCRKFRDLDIPIVGLNIGTLGFLPELSLANYERTFRDLKEGKIDYVVQEKTGLYVECEDEFEERLFAVNECTIARGFQARIIDIEIYINGIYLDTFNADGMIVGTATGSTGYSLSAGGPILLPTSTDVILTPICPHQLSARPIVVTKDDIVTLKMVSEARGQQTRAIMTIDGQVSYPIKTDSTINIKTRNKKLKIIVFDEEVFYRKLRDKIK